MLIKIVTLIVALLPALVLAQAPSTQNTPVGTWRTIDDKTGKVKSIVEIYPSADGSLSGKVLKVLDSDQGPNPICDECKGANHNKPIAGMVIAWGLRHEGDTWDSGKILDPKNGKIYSAKMTPIENGRKLQVRGYLGFSLLGRTQIWVRD